MECDCKRCRPATTAQPAAKGTCCWCSRPECDGVSCLALDQPATPAAAGGGALARDPVWERVDNLAQEAVSVVPYRLALAGQLMGQLVIGGSVNGYEHAARLAVDLADALLVEVARRPQVGGPREGGGEGG
jgi:hypothetical protein